MTHGNEWLVQASSTWRLHWSVLPLARYMRSLATGYTHTLCFTPLRFPFAVAYCPVFCLPIPGCICHAGLHKAYTVQALPPVPQAVSSKASWRFMVQQTGLRKHIGMLAYCCLPVVWSYGWYGARESLLANSQKIRLDRAMQDTSRIFSFFIQESPGSSFIRCNIGEA